MLNKKTYTAKTYDEAVNQALADLMDVQENLFIKEVESTKGLFSKKSVIEVVRKDDVLEYIKEMIKDICNYMGLTVQMEIKKREESVNISIYSENNSILIGKNARTLNALTTIIKQAVHNVVGENYKFVIDVSDYKEKQHYFLEKAAKKAAKEVQKTKIPVKLDPMNSYERRLVHNALSGFKGIYTESEGEEPHRCVVIKYQEPEKKEEVKEEIEETTEE